MNPRLQQLADQCTNQYRDDHGGYIDEIDIETFAELIVRECADLTRWREKDMSAEQRIRLEIYREIKDHFGVKE
jgi:hypothetical protein